MEIIIFCLDGATISIKKNVQLSLQTNLIHIWICKLIHGKFGKKIFKLYNLVDGYDGDSDFSFLFMFLIVTVYWE